MLNSKEIYDGLLVSVGVIGISYAGQKFVKMGLGVDHSLKGVAKLTVGIVGSTMFVGYLQQNKYIPEDIMEKKTA